MKSELRVGIVDSGHSLAQRPRVVAGRRFYLVADGLAEAPLRDDPLGHGSAVIDAISLRAPSAMFCVAQVFDQRGVTSALQIATAIDWLVAQEVRLINLSLGLRQDRSLLREACAAAQERGVLLCASSPAQGAAVFPASYPGVLRITGDARCEAHEWSWLNSQQADFAACVRGTPAGQSGASLGCAALSGHIARFLVEHDDGNHRQIIEWLRENARYHGPERRVWA
ncbi:MULTISPECIES: S8 family serine peptidase [unclassified Pseudomonas]|uniref:S8 family serine peptidase n=1 Tax=Pseudomonas sp. Hg7Tf TaxID=3236988 RepID=A0AB39I8R3_9PSED|nr:MULTISPECIES: S8 family serine peptidase [unclassified Pseudomonas]KJK08180.1 peptidase S8 and S53 subtilisin kexin sedolisin [Pseudomonas sp. 5]MDH2562007.1 peptidase S8 and S53 subtilisin kexin sedolisin [Pseudomonas sp. Hg5Tf]QYX49144.1 peptidase S8 and S53 subtilisin kexin sedolisin [Pseudomonas sp. S11A 273]